MAQAPVRVPFLLVSAFTANRDSGNPAAVVFLPSTGTSYPTEWLQAITKNLNQPITAFLSPLPEPATAVTDTDVKADFAIRWFTVEAEIPLCGHGTLAASQAIFAAPDLAGQLNGKFKENGKLKLNRDVAGEEGLLRFQTISGTIVSARKTTLTLPNSGSEVEQIQISFPHAPTIPITPTSPAGVKIHSALATALQKPAGDVDIAYMGHGEGPFDHYLLVELGGRETLDGREIARDAFVRIAGFGFKS
jgi:hypothetical protein